MGWSIRPPCHVRKKRSCAHCLAPNTRSLRRRHVQPCKAGSGRLHQASTAQVTVWKGSLDLAAPLGLFSHGIVPGTIQVPPSGKPIIQMADANTCGGYPKIATVAEPDLRLLAQSSVGSIIHFVETTREEIVSEMRAQALRSEQLAAELASLRHKLIPWRS